MHHFAVAISDDPTVDFTSRLDEFIARSLIFKPDLAICTSSCGAFIASFQANRKAFGVESWSDISDESSVLLFGLPTFENQPAGTQAMARTNPAKAVKEVISRKGFNSLYVELGGVFLVVYVVDGTVRTTATFCGYGSVLVHRSPGLLIVGNKLTLVLGLMPPDRRRPNFLAASWVCTTTMILGDQAAYHDIHKIKPGYRFTGSLEQTDCHLQAPLFFASPAAGTEEKEAIFDRLIRRYEYWLNLPVRWQAHITGGKDSRAALSAIIASGAIDRVEFFRTIGSPENGDVIVATRLMEKTGLRNHVVTADDKASDLTEDDILRMYDRFSYTAWRYDGHLTAWDGRGAPARECGSVISLMGGGGEIYRQKGLLFPRHDFRACVTRLANWYGRHNHLGIVNGHYVEAQERLLSSFIAEQRELGAVNLQSALYIFHRMSNWGAGHFQNNANGAVAGLVDLELARFAHVSEDCGDSVHYEMIKYCHPALLECSLLNDTWEALGDRGPKALQVPTQKDFPWQYALVKGKWTRLVDEILDGASALGDVLDRDVLSKLRKGTSPDASEAIKMIFGARTLIALYSGEAHGTPDFMDEDYEPHCVGIHAARLRQSFFRAGFMKPGLSAH